MHHVTLKYGYQIILNFKLLRRISFLAGFIVARTIMSIIASGVNAVIVLFAESPAELEKNYPDLCREMKEAYMEVYGVSPSSD